MKEILREEQLMPQEMRQRPIDGYLERIGYKGTPRPDLETLRALQRAHVHTVPYENLDIREGRQVSVCLCDVYDKIVTRRRGGYCFELNGLFAWLLRRVGFDVTEYYGRYLLDEPLSVPMRRHRIACVALDGRRYICDVGVGVRAPMYPLLFEPDVIQDMEGETYRLVRCDALGYAVEGVYHGEWNRLYSFTEDEQYQIDFEMPNHWCTTHPDSIFRNTTMVYMRTVHGRNTIADVESDGKTVQEFRRYTEAGLETFIPATRAEYEAALLADYGIVL